MSKSVITLVLIIFSVFTNAQNWSDKEISTLQKFSLKALKPSVDTSNKYHDNQQAIAFGKALFFDKRLSSDGKISCSSCHDDKYAFTDNRKLAFGTRQGFRNTSTLLNVGSQDWFFADGAKDSLWSQALSSIENPAEQNFTRTELLHLIFEDINYRNVYQRIVKKELTIEEIENLPEKAGPNSSLEKLIAWKKLDKEQRQQINTVFTNAGKAIAAYVATIKSSESRFDNFVDELADKKTSTLLNDSEQRGLKLFMSKESGCANCHSGPLFSNKTFHDISTGIPGKDNGRSEVIESIIRDEFNCLGKYSDAKPEECDELKYINRDKHQLTGSYKTSTLRNIIDTAPYMHDGRFETLYEVINHYLEKSQEKPKKNDLTPIELNKEQQLDLVNFLLTL